MEEEEGEEEGAAANSCQLCIYLKDDGKRINFAF